MTSDEDIINVNDNFLNTQPESDIKLNTSPNFPIFNLSKDFTSEKYVDTPNIEENKINKEHSSLKFNNKKITKKSHLDSLKKKDNLYFTVYSIVIDEKIKGYTFTLKKAQNYIKRYCSNIVDNYAKKYPNWQVHINKENLNVNLTCEFKFFLLSYEQVISKISIVKIKLIAN